MNFCVQRQEMCLTTIKHCDRMTMVSGLEGSGWGARNKIKLSIKQILTSFKARSITQLNSNDLIVVVFTQISKVKFIHGNIS